MSQGNGNRVKRRKKSEVWAKHGKHRPVLGWLCEQRRSSTQFRYVTEWYATVEEAFAAAKRLVKGVR